MCTATISPEIRFGKIVGITNIKSIACIHTDHGSVSIKLTIAPPYPK